MDNNTGNTLLAVIVGSAIGAALGILYAPDYAVNAGGLMNVASKISEEKETLDTRVESLVTDISYKTEDVISTLEEKLAELKAKNKKLQKTS